MVGERYEIQEYVGEGGMQFVYLAKDILLGRYVALKTPKNNAAQKRFRRSAVVSARVNHPNVAKTLDYLEFDERSYLAEEFIEGNDLDKGLLRKFYAVDPYLVARLFHNLSKGLWVSHDAGVVHRDLKPSNIMLVGDVSIEAVKITDFGIAKLADEELTEAAVGGGESITNSQTAVGALPYMSPEAISAPDKTAYPSDVWSLGAMMYEVLTGTKPFGTGLMAITEILSDKEPALPEELLVNPQFAGLVQQIYALATRCMSRTIEDRPTARELVQECETLCYPIEQRYLGSVRDARYRWGFISENGTDVFYHNDSIYGPGIADHDPVCFSKFPGGGADRAHPVMKVKV
nr:serine/threonine-protein kinase [Microbulbifer sediminum]